MRATLPLRSNNPTCSTQDRHTTHCFQSANRKRKFGTRSAIQTNILGTFHCDTSLRSPHGVLIKAPAGGDKLARDTQPEMPEVPVHPGPGAPGQVRPGSPPQQNTQKASPEPEGGPCLTTEEKVADHDHNAGSSKESELGREAGEPHVVEVETDLTSQEQLGSQGKELRELKEELHKRQREPEQEQLSEQSQSRLQHLPKQQRIQSTWQEVLEAGCDMNHLSEPCYKADAKNHVYRDAEVQGGAGHCIRNVLEWSTIVGLLPCDLEAQNIPEDGRMLRHVWPAALADR